MSRVITVLSRSLVSKVNVLADTSHKTKRVTHYASSLITISATWCNNCEVFLCCVCHKSNLTSQNLNKKLSYGRDSVQCRNCHSRSLKVIRLRQSTQNIYDFILALNSNLTSIINRSWDIAPSLHLSIPHLSSRWNWKKTARSRETCFGVRVPRTLDYPTINLYLR